MSTSKVSDTKSLAYKRAKTTGDIPNSPASNVGTNLLGAVKGGGDMLTGGAGSLVGGVGKLGNALNPLQLLGPGKKKKKKDDRVYRSRNDNDFDDCESADQGDSSDEEDDEPSKGLDFLKKQELNLQKEVDRNRAMIEVEQ